MAASYASKVTVASVTIVAMNGMNSVKGVVKSAAQAFSLTIDNSDEGTNDGHNQDTNVWITLQNFDNKCRVVATLISNAVDERQVQLSAAYNHVHWIVKFGAVVKIE